MDDAVAVPSQQPVDLPGIPVSFGTIDIKGKIVVLKAGDRSNEQERALLLNAMHPVLMGAGAAMVVMLTPGADINTLGEDDLARAGLRRMTPQEIAMRDDRSSNGG